MLLAGLDEDELNDYRRDFARGPTGHISTSVCVLRDEIDQFGRDGAVIVATNMSTRSARYSVDAVHTDLLPQLLTTAVEMRDCQNNGGSDSPAEER